MKFTKFSIIAIIFMSVIVFHGCANISQSKWCNNIPEDSYSVICEAADKVGTTPENVSTIIKVVDLLLLEETHTAKQAMEFFTNLEMASAEAQMLDGATYSQFVSYIASKYENLPAKIRAAIILVEEFNGLDLSDGPPRLLSDHDWWMIDKALADQKAAIAPFL